MSKFEILRGNERGCVLGTPSTGWFGVEVIRWKGEEALSEPYRFTVTVLRPRSEGPLDLELLVDDNTTLLIRSPLADRAVHGIVASVEEIERTPEHTLYELLVVPPFERARHRVRSRTFVGRTLREILSYVLENRSTESPEGFAGHVGHAGGAAPFAFPEGEHFGPARATYRFAVSTPERLDHPTLRAYTVQYGETDADFVSRLLEEEGLTYLYEHTVDEVIFTITDNPGSARLLSHTTRARLDRHVKGLGQDHEVVTKLTATSRMGLGPVEVRDWDPTRPLGPRRGLARGEREEAWDAYGELRFPGRDEAMAAPCVSIAEVRRERRAVESAMRVGRSTLRAIAPGWKVSIVDVHGGQEVEVVIVRVTTFATYHVVESDVLSETPFGLSPRGHDRASYENAFEALDARIQFRPEQKTTRPRIDGVQCALVTADEVGNTVEIHRNAEGEVRLRFPWDQRSEPGTPSSCWVRVSQGWAGAGFGQIFTPRVHQEVLVAYQEGDPDRPLIVGRVYDAVQPIRYEKATISAITTKSSPGSDGYNELRFDDETGNEEVYIQAERDYNLYCKRNGSTSIGVDHKSFVGGKSDNTVVGALCTQAASVSVGTGAHTLSCTSSTVTASGDISLMAGDERKDVSTNHNIKTGGLWVNAKACAQFVTPKFTVMANTIVLKGAGGTITIGPDGIQIHGSVVDVKGAPIQLNC